MKEIPYPINFIELNVPAIVDDFKVTDSSNLAYFLDFEKSFTKSGKEQNNFNRKNLIKVLKGLEKKIDEDLRKALYNKSELKKGRFKVTIDNGLRTSSADIRYGNQKIHKINHHKGLTPIGIN